MANAHLLSSLIGDQSAGDFLRGLLNKSTIASNAARDKEVRRVLGAVKNKIEDVVLFVFISMYQNVLSKCFDFSCS